MSKRYQKELSQVEYLEKEIKVLKSENKGLKKKLKVLNKGYYKYLYSETEEEEKEALADVKAIATKICYQCNTGSLKLVILGNRYIRACDSCSRTTPSKLVINLKE